MRLPQATVVLSCFLLRPGAAMAATGTAASAAHAGFPSAFGPVSVLEAGLIIEKLDDLSRMRSEDCCDPSRVEANLSQISSAFDPKGSGALDILNPEHRAIFGPIAEAMRETYLQKAEIPPMYEAVEVAEKMIEGRLHKAMETIRRPGVGLEELGPALHELEQLRPFALAYTPFQVGDLDHAYSEGHGMLQGSQGGPAMASLQTILADILPSDWN